MKSNVIFIIVDTLRADACLFPNIGKLARQGIVFTNAYASTTKTDPSISSIFSGQYPHTVGLVAHGQKLSQEEEKNVEKAQLLTEILQRHSLKTYGVDWLSRWHARGYDQYSGKILPDASPQGLIADKFFFLRYLRKLDRLFLVRFLKRDFLTRLCFSSLFKKPVPYDPADVVVDQAIDYLQNHCQNYPQKNFFLYLHLWDPHWPHVRPKGLKSFFLDTVVDRYLAEVKFADNHLGRLFDYLREKKLREKTLIILTGDHGESLTEHGIFLTHQGLYEEVIHVPLIFYHPHFKKGKIKSLVAHIDIFPTILDFLGIKSSKKIDGRSLLPLILGKKKKIRDFVFFEDVVFGQMKIKKPKRRRGVRVGDYKYLQYLKVNNQNVDQIFLNKKTPIIAEELFNLKKDPQEKHNLNLILKKKKESLRKILSAHLEALKLRKNDQ